MPVICFVVTHPTQFEVPFYKAVAKIKSQWTLEVIYTVAEESAEKYDIELNRNIKWGFPLYEGYIYHSITAKDSTEKIEELLLSRNVALLITNSYKDGYEHFVMAAHKIGVPVALRLDSVLLGKSILEKWARRILLAKYYNQFIAFFPTGTTTRQYMLEMGKKASDLYWFPYCTDNHFFSESFTTQQLSDIWSKYQIQNRETVLLGICKFNKRENPLDLLKAFCILNDPSLHLIMIGDGPLSEELKQYAAKFPQLKIHFPGYVSYAELPAWYHASHVFVHTALHEPWGVSVQEALAAGCRVVTSNRVGSAYDLIKAGKNGFIYTVKDPVQLAGYLKKTLLLPQQVFEDTQKEVLKEWNYETVWQQMQQAASVICKK